MARIVRFNWPWYAAGVLACVAATAALRCGGGGWWRWIATPGVALTAFWLVSSLVVSHYVYDRSPLATGAWLRRLAAGPSPRVAVFHAGHDEISHRAAGVFDSAAVEVFDFYDPAGGATPSLERARRAAASRATSVSAHSLPLRRASVDLGLVVLAAHELRKQRDRVAFFGELARVLAPGGRALMVEHLRDPWNFAAYGPGAFHFFSRRVWRRALAEGGLRARREWRCTPFVRVFEVTGKC